MLRRRSRDFGVMILRARFAPKCTLVSRCRNYAVATPGFVDHFHGLAALGGKRRVVGEDVFGPVIGCDESKALLCVKPLGGACGHETFSLVGACPRHLVGGGLIADCP